ncbi:Solute carrier organic anion transporter member 3A1 [Bulinus truncatus]|nr:Solute carrier organic anion transporter member 3A1 [Bulinus truncatus]
MWLGIVEELLINWKWLGIVGKLLINWKCQARSHYYDIPLCVDRNRTELTSPLCQHQTQQSSPVISLSETWRNIAILTLGIGMALQGMAKSPRHPFLGTYVDDNVPKTKTSMYLGTMVGLSITGPAIAFTLGGVFSKMYITLEETNMSPRDPRWLGAWWLGFLVFGLLGLIVGIPLAFFPRRFHAKPVTEVQSQVTSNKYKLIKDVKGLLKVLLRLVLNPVYVCIILSNGVNLMCVSGFLAFMPKYLETQFNIPAWQVNMYLGAMNIAAAFVGTILGGCLTTRLKLSPLSCLKAVVISKCLGALLGATGFFTGCSQPVFQSSSFESNNSNNCTICNQQQLYFPVCGAGQWNYLSPCHAGCHSVGKNNMYTQCFNLPTNSTQTVLGNLCHSGCQNLYIFLAVMFITAFITTLVMMPAFIVSVRSIAEEDKPLAIGLSSFSGTLLGWFPGPIIFGSLIDTTCLVWKKSCQSTGACLLYNIDQFRIRFHALVVGLRMISIILCCTALVVVVYFKRFSFQDHQNLELTAVCNKSVI